MAELTLTADVALNGQSCDVVVYEDTNQDGSAENQDTITLQDGSNQYTVSGMDGGTGNDYWLDLKPATSASDTTPEINSITLDTSTTVSGGSTDETVSFGGASDWDNAVSEQGVRHAIFGDVASADPVRLGFPVPSVDTLAYYHYDDSSGPFEDISGNAHDATNNGASPGSAGALGTTAATFDGSDYTEAANAVPNYTTDGVTLFAVIKSTDTGTRFFGAYPGNTPYLYLNINSNGNFEIDFRTSTDNFQNVSSSTTLNDGVYHAVMGVVDLSNQVLRLYVDGTEVLNTSNSELSGDFTFGDDGSSIFFGGDVNGAGADYTGDADTAVWMNTAVSAQFAKDYTAGISSGQITTATKTFGSEAEPDLENLTYSLNGESITLDVIGSPGTASEEIQSVTLDGSSSYSISWASGHTDFRVLVDLSTTDGTSTPTFTSGDLVSTSASSDADQNESTTWEIQGAKYDTSGNEYEGGGMISRYGG